MTCDELLNEIYELLSEGSPNQASDLLTEFIFNLPQIPSCVSLEKYGSLSDGSPDEIVERLRKVFKSNNQLMHICDENDSFLTKSDLALIDEIATKLESSTVQYILDEENAPPKISCSNLSALIEGSAPAPSDKHEEQVAAELNFRKIHNDKLIQIAMNAAKSDDEIDLDLLEMESQLPEEMLLNACEIEELEELDFDDFSTAQDVYCADLITDVDYDPFEFDGYQERENLIDVDYIDRLTRCQRARQVAVIVAVTYQFDQEGVDLLEEIFEANGWGAARVAIENLIKSGTSLETLFMAKELKDIWAENESYSLAFLGLSNRTGYCTYQGGRVLSWPMAVKIVNLFPNGEIEEVERFLDRAFDRWYESDRIKLEFNVFLNYMKHLISTSAQFRIIPEFLLQDENLSEEFEFESEKFGYSGPVYSDLLKYGLIPDLWDSYSCTVASKKSSNRNELLIIEDDEDEDCDDDE